MFNPASNERGKGVKLMPPISSSKEQKANTNATEDFCGHLQAKTPFTTRKVCLS